MEGVTALGWSCQKGRFQAVQCLLDRGAEVNQVDHTGKVPLDHAATQGNPTIVQKNKSRLSKAMSFEASSESFKTLRTAMRRYHMENGELKL